MGRLSDRDPIECPDGQHSYSPLIMGANGKEVLRCQRCPHNEEITGEMYAAWRAYYDECVANGVEYHGVMGDYVPERAEP